MQQIKYVKIPPKSLEDEGFRPKKNRKISSLMAKGFMVLGVLIIANVAWPIISYEIFTAPSLKPQDFLSPVPVHGREQDQEQGVVSQNSDLTQPQNWFPKAQFSKPKESSITHYTLSIPRFNIKDATVEIGGDDLSKSLIQYPETANPGESGATIIFGHSILEQFFNPKNYLAIFSLIPKMERGDDIIVRYDGITYTYRVIDKLEVQPTNLSVLEQPYDNEYLRLITCTPPGTYLRRAVITATLID